jgi:hypothetical protein
MAEHTYPRLFPPGTHWATDEAWAILDAVRPGVIDPETRAYLSGLIAGTLMRLVEKPPRDPHVPAS